MKGLILVVIIVLLVSLIGFASNPTFEDYKEWYKTQNYDDVEASTKLEKSVVGLVSDFVADSTVERDDYKVYSVYTVDNEDYNYKVIGAFNNFFVLENGKSKEAAKTE